MKERDFDIEFVGLKEGSHVFDYQIKSDFFELFESSEEVDFDADLQIQLDFKKSEVQLELSLKIDGALGLVCDVTEQPYEHPVSLTFDWLVKFGERENLEEDALWIIPRTAHKLNIANVIRDSVLLELPTNRIHPKVVSGEIENEQTKLYYSYLKGESGQEEEVQDEISTFGALLKKQINKNK